MTNQELAEITARSTVTRHICQQFQAVGPELQIIINSAADVPALLCEIDRLNDKLQSLDDISTQTIEAFESLEVTEDTLEDIVGRLDEKTELELLSLLAQRIAERLFPGSEVVQ